jgi:hypothetical protein
MNKLLEENDVRTFFVFAGAAGGARIARGGDAGTQLMRDQLQDEAEQ